MACRSRLTPVLRRASAASLVRPISSGASRHTLRCISTSSPRQLKASGPSQTKFTTDTYPEIKRDERFAQISPEHVKFFKDLLGKESAVIDGVTAEVSSDDMEPYNGDWMRKYRGHCKLVLKPGSTEEVSKILKYCNDNMLAVVPQGGNTGLVGGSVPVFDEIVLNTSRLNQIRSFDDVSGILVADAGVVLEVADQYLAEKGYIFPLDLGAKGSCHIGGNVATNAGGLRLLRYGSLHGSVLGIEAVLPDGTIVDDLSKLRKNNTGYDLKQLFIGGEGTIGMITAVSIQCPQRSSAVNVAFLAVESYEKMQQAFREARQQLGEILSAFELMDLRSQQMVHEVRGSKSALEGEHPFYCLIETSGSNSDHDSEKLGNFLEDVMGREIVTDGVLAQDETQIRSLWSMREGVPECVNHWGGVYKYDVSIPLGDMYRIVDETREKIDAAGLRGDTDEFPVVDVVGYGHMGDSNLHLNVAVRRYDKRVEKVLEPFVYEWIAKVNGSISAEHGLGIAKKNYIGYSRSETMIGLMKQIKKLYDPNGIMNPYKRHRPITTTPNSSHEIKMDGDLSNFDLDKLNEKDKEQLRTFLAAENQKARVQSSEFPGLCSAVCERPYVLVTSVRDLVPSSMRPDMSNAG
ncbi:putative D-lactate dehydrogenase [Seiridium unicorne]|uniref:D-lactate dehydrogenase n=1 Tax=Seiridium unicorne TaxID=138068 RepID=A0ABR2VAB9_9PEZI